MHLMTMQHALELQYLHPATTDFVEIKMSDQASDFGTPLKPDVVIRVNGK